MNTASIAIANTGAVPIRVMIRPGEFVDIEPGEGHDAVISGDLIISPMAPHKAEEEQEPEVDPAADDA